MNLESLVVIVQKYVRDQIITGGFKPNQKLKEEEVASYFNISRPPVREAFSILEAEGLVVKKPRRGVFVTEPQIDDVWEIYTLKAGLYEMSMEMAYDKIGPDELADLQEMVNDMNHQTKGGSFDIIGYQHTHIRFHKSIMEIAGNRRLTSYTETLHNQVCRFSYKALQYKEHVQEIMDYHNRIFQAVKDCNKSLACGLMKKHVLEGLRFQLQIFQEKEWPQEVFKEHRALENVS